MNVAVSAEKILNGAKSSSVREKLIGRTPKSAKLSKKGQASLAQEVVQTVDLPHPIYIESADGPYLTDVDGNRYVDLTAGFGPNVLGNRPKVVEQAISNQIKKGWHFGIPGPGQSELAGILKEASPVTEQVVFCNSGSEATMFAFRAARAYTGKQVVALFDGSYHGIHDYALTKADLKSDRSKPRSKVMGAGVPEVVPQELMLMLPYRDENAFDLIRQHKDSLAMVVVEPVQSSNPRLDNQKFFKGLREVCTECGVLLLFDEVITGFRIEFGGCQEYYGIDPDLVTYGKAIGGGLPIGAIAGPRKIMNTFSGADGTPAIFAGGTFNGNPLTMSAGIAALSFLKENKKEIYPFLHEQGNRFAREINDFCETQNIPAKLMNAGSMMHLLFGKGEINSSRDIDYSFRKVEQEFYLHLLGHDVIVPGIHLSFLSWAHKTEIVDQIIEAYQSSFMDLRADELI